MPLPQLIGRQREVVYLPASGHTVVLGTAGSGKTAMAIYRAAYLARDLTPDGQRVLLVTFNKTLTKYLRAWAGPDLPGSVDVETYHHFGLGYLGNITGQYINVLNSKEQKRHYIREALENTRTDLGDHEVLHISLDQVINEFEWISKIGVQSQQDYEEIERYGGSVSRIQQNDRTILYHAYERYRQIRNDHGYQYDWDDIALGVINQFSTDRSLRRYHHIVIDEGQDFSSSMLCSLVSAVPQNGSITFFGDIAQQIYGSRVSWRTAGLNIGQPWVFRENYRNSRQIARLGIAITNMPYYQGVADIVQPREPRADGPLPVLALCQSSDHEIEECTRLAIRQSRTQTVAIISRDRSSEARFRGALQQQGIIPTRLHRDMAAWTFSPGIYLGTYHSAKGLEFDTVILPFCSQGIFPSPTRTVEVGDENEAISDEGKLLYVGVTRAKNNLILTFSGQISPLLPSDPTLFNKVTL